MKRTILILNWLIIAFIVISIVLSMATSLMTDPEEPIELGAIGGADGPTAVFISTRTAPEILIIPLLIAVVLLMNNLVIRKQEKQIANQRVDLTR